MFDGLLLQGSYVVGTLIEIPEDFKVLRDGVPSAFQPQFHRFFISDPEASDKCMVEIPAEKGMPLTVQEVNGFLKPMDEDDECDDFELDAVALFAVACG